MSRMGLSRSEAYRWGAAALFLATASILIALGFEHIGKVRPCALCYQQRWPYYATIPVLFVALVLLTSGRPRFASALFGLVALGFLLGAGLGVHHAGVEWGFWPGPESCSATSLAPLKPIVGLNQSVISDVVRCDQPSASFLGLTFAGWNVVASLMLFTASLKAAFAAREHETYL